MPALTTWLSSGSGMMITSTRPDRNRSRMLGNGTSTNVIFLESTPWSRSHSRYKTSEMLPMPLTPVRLPTRSCGDLISTPVRATTAADFMPRVSTESPVSAASSMPPSTACRNTGGASVPI
jgi:hypothetical protein